MIRRIAMPPSISTRPTTPSSPVARRLGLTVAYARLHASLLVTLDARALCLLAAALLGMIARASLDEAELKPRVSPTMTKPARPTRR